MRIALCADVHLGNHKRFGGEVLTSMNERCRMAVETFAAAAKVARKEQCDSFIVAGDLFDYARPEAPLLAAVLSVLEETEADGVEVFLLRGNHEQVSNAFGDHALAPLRAWSRIVEVPQHSTRWAGKDCGLEVFFVPFQPGHAREWLPGAVRALVGASEAGGKSRAAGVVRLLVLHLGIKDAKTAPWLHACADSIDVELLGAICDDAAIPYVFAGNWHDRREWRLPNQLGTYVLQLGALCPTGWDNPGLEGYGTVAIFDDEAASKLREDAVRIVEIPGPRFVKAASKKEAQVEMVSARKAGHKLFVSFDAQPEDLEELTTIVEAATQRGDIRGGEVVPNQEVAIVKAKSAAFAAKSAKTLLEALAAFIRVMPMPEGVQRTSIQERARGYLR